MAGSTTKKVIIRRFDREPVNGFVSPASYLHPEGVEVLRPDGTVARLPYPEVKAVCFVKDFDSGPGEERLLFTSRPKTAGLWVRMKFRDGELMDGILPNNLLQIDSHGFAITPPDGYSNNQHLFIPRTALIGIEVLGVVGSALRRGRKKEPSRDQFGLFEGPDETPLK